MKVLLVFPGKGLSPAPSDPLSLEYIASYLISKKISTAIVDLQIINEKEVMKLVKNNQDLEVIGFSVFTHNYKGALRISKQIKKFKDIPIVFGGPHVFSIPTAKEALKNEEIDFIVRGEGEHTMLKLVNTIIHKKNNFSDILGILYKDNNKIIINPERALIKDVDSLPFPARNLVDIKTYLDLRRKHGLLRGIDVYSSRGCPFNCCFCMKTFGHKVRLRSPSSVVEEIQEIKLKYDVKHIRFVDSLFTARKSHALALCKELEPLDILWSCETRVDRLDKDLFFAMKKAGCFHILMGIESGSQTVLNRMNKLTKVEDIIQKVNMAHKLGFELTTSFIIGLPGETRETIQESVRLAKRLNAKYIFFNILTPYPGTPIFQNPEKFGIEIISRNWDKYHPQNGSPVIRTKELSADDLTEEWLKIFDQFYVK